MDDIDAKQQGGFVWHEPVIPRGYHAALPPSATCEWATPWPLFRRLDAEFDFTVDVAASTENAKCARFYTMEQDGLKQSWAGERVWCNPPYDHKSLTAFAYKAVYEKARGTLSALLVPVKSDQAWWHEYAIQHEIRFIRGRVAFGGAAAAPMPVCIVVISADHGPKVTTLKQPQLSIMDRINER